MRTFVLAFVACSDPPTSEPGLQPFTAVTFNTGTTPGLAHDADKRDGYTSAEAELSDLYYGDGLAWNVAVDAAARFFEDTQPELIAFQEIFAVQACSSVPQEARRGFVCDGYEPGDPSVAERVLGDAYAVACHPDKPDKCVAVRQDWGQFAGPMTGFPVEGCGSGARVAHAEVELTAGGTVDVVSVHGSSGLSGDDQDCRIAQVDQVFVDLGDGQPGVRGTAHVVMGDFNTDPVRFANADPSAVRWTEFIGDGRPFRWITEVGEQAPRTYQGLATIDHVATDAFVGDCVHPGVTDELPAVLDTLYFDHVPALCALQPER